MVKQTATTSSGMAPTPARSLPITPLNTNVPVVLVGKFLYDAKARG